LDRSERIASVALVALGLFVAFYARQYLKIGMMISPGAGFLPFCIGIALTVLGVIWFLQTLYTRKAQGPIEQACSSEDIAEGSESRRTRILYRFLPGVLLVILYAWLLEKAGYILSTTLFMVGWQKAVERQGWLKTAVIALLAAGGMYTLFSYLLKVFLPTGTWFD
jgi:putative tricarboxylic transport membrane protein